MKTNIFIYTDESGVFDHEHEDYFVLGGVIFFSKDDRDNENRKFLKAERDIRNNGSYENGCELKASILSNRDKGKLFRSINNCEKFAVVINLKRVHKSIFDHKKSKQRYLDYAYKIMVKKYLVAMINKKRIDPNRIAHVYVFADEHTTATDGRYELKEGLENELKIGTFNSNYNRFFPPIFPTMGKVEVSFRNSDSVALIRAADIICNRVYYHSNKNMLSNLRDKIHIIRLP